MPQGSGSGSLGRFFLLMYTNFQWNFQVFSKKDYSQSFVLMLPICAYNKHKRVFID